ncbi:MAG: hypothetical protein ABIJ61_13580 [bacterium]
MRTALFSLVLLTLLFSTPLLALSGQPPLIKIERSHHGFPGHYDDISITAQVDSGEITAFDLTIAVRPDALKLIEVTSNSSTICYGKLNPAAIEDTVNTGFLRIVGRPRTGSQDSTGAIELAVIKYLISNSPEFDCGPLSIRFAWSGCEDNRLTLSDGRQVVASRVFDWSWEGDLSSDDYEITGNDCAVDWFAHYCGVCDLCDGREQSTAQVGGVFWNGVIDIACWDGDSERRGDINQNGIDNEISDVRLLANGILYGSDSLRPADSLMRRVTDVNNDCVPASIADLVYCVRIVTGDALPFPKLGPVRSEYCLKPPRPVIPYPWHAWIHKNRNVSPPEPPSAPIHDSVLVDTRNGTLELSTDKELAGLFAIFELDGEQQIDSLTCLMPMQLEHTMIDNQLRVLIWSGLEWTVNKIPPGNQTLFEMPRGATLLFLQASDYNGNLLDVIQVTDSGQVRLPSVWEP